MSFRLMSPRTLIYLLTGSFFLCGLLAQSPRYPELDDPFGPRRGPPPPAQKMRERDQQGSPSPVRDPHGPQIGTTELINGLEESSNRDVAPESQINLQQLQALERFLNTPPEQLARIRETIERVEAMSEEEKQALREKIRNFRRLEEDKISKLRDLHELWKDVPRDQRQLLHRYMMSLPKEDANAIRQEWARMPEGESSAYLEQLLSQAREAEASGELPTLAETIRRWRLERDDGMGPRDRRPNERINTSESNRD